LQSHEEKPSQGNLGRCLGDDLQITYNPVAR
jgi:hypothetical protein